mmetsp:Transcript_1049/g.1873  ORF Transcript_1049/g.1873 Transcript_1049/m.1873 type:complete len:536 (+) Transcript_1049:297-1904(+)|eukprot:CAMPEP_0176498294 /NCGR_PEP_ID=MMETSP0200_2-20121128/12236_1 /TAXON_ID=947934 /ORGANISM="Chaetoceros sp., Strain GSL56" /LENGTH=535 /DNA_ID=CAMNT_0017896475 /DNA_START=234 /DNA_END=1841 /DNA_ORIENTATION=+
MASEQIVTPVVAVDDNVATDTAEITQQQAPQSQENKKGAKQKETRQRVPPEELYDLTKPIPKTEKPDKAKHDEEIQAINAAIDALKESKLQVQQQIELALNGGRNSAAGKEREALRVLRQKKGLLIEEKKAMRARLDLAKKTEDNLMNDRKAARANVRFSDVASIDQEIAKLKKRQETTSMSLNDEKRLIKEIDTLQQSKQMLDEIKGKDADIDNAREQRKLINAEMNAKNKEIDAVQVEIDAKQKEVDAMKDNEVEARKNLSALKAQKEEIRKEIGEKMDERNKCREDFREASDKWYDYQRALKAQKKLKYEEEKKKREEEKAAFFAAKEAEEAKKVPYEEEMNLCDYLANYLSKTYLSDKSEDKEDTKQGDTVTVKDDPFAGFKPLKKDDDAVFLKMGDGKKPRVRTSKKKPAPVFKLNVDSFEQFGLLGLTPPTSLEAVQGSVDELKAKKEWYSKQERGSVPTAAEIRKAKEKEAQKLIQSGSATTKNNKKLDIMGEDFAPLSTGGTTVSVNSSWGQKVPEQTTDEVAADEE